MKLLEKTHYAWPLNKSLMFIITILLNNILVCQVNLLITRVRLQLELLTFSGNEQIILNINSMRDS